MPEVEIKHLLFGDAKSQQGHGNSLVRAHAPQLGLAMPLGIPRRIRPVNVNKSHVNKDEIK